MRKIIPLIALFILPLLLFSQNELYNQGNSIYLQSGALIHVQGTLTNAVNPATLSAGSITNNGIIELDGDFNCASGTTFQPDLGTASTNRAVKFTGSGTQFIKGTGTATFYNVVLDKQSASDTVKMQTNVDVTGSLVFNTAGTYSSLYPSGVFTTTYNPTITGATNNGYGGLLKTFDGTTYDGGTGNEYLLDIQNANTDAIQGYPALVVNGNPATGYVVTKGTSGSASGGLQRAIGSAATYTYPTGTILHGFNGVNFNFTSVPSGTKTVKGKFCDYQTSASGISGTGYTGTIDDTCVTCSGNYAAPDNNGWNYYFSSDPCNSNNPQWFILQGLVIKHGYWTFTSSNNSAFTYSIETFPNNITGPQNLTLETWRMLKYDDAAHTYGYDPSQQNWTSQITSQVSSLNDLLTYSLNTGYCYTGNGIPGGLYTGFSEFSLGKSNSNNALPVQLVSLVAEAIDNRFIKVSWITDLEINNKGFVVERSTDAVNFDSIGWVNGHDNSTLINNYALNDMNVVAGVVYYYRLIQEDNNGIKTPTGIVQASLTGNTVFTVGDPIPNPATDNSHLLITTGIEQPINMKVYDGIGQVLSTKGYSLTAGENEIALNTGTLAAGTYMIIINANNQYYSRKLVVLR